MILRTLVMLMPLATMESATQPATLAEMAIVSQGSTERKPERIRSMPSTYSHRDMTHAPTEDAKSNSCLPSHFLISAAVQRSLFKHCPHSHNQILMPDEVSINLWS